YLNRIQSVDPYIALELAQGQPVPNDAFRLEELDYRRAAEREILTSSPDWLRDLGSSGEPAAASTAPASTDDAAWMESFAPSKPTDQEDLPVFDEAFSPDPPDDWLTDLPEIPAEPVAPSAGSNLPPSQQKSGLTGLLDRVNLPETPAPTEPEPDLDSLF